MNDKKEVWLKEATEKLNLLREFDDMFLVPDGKTLNAFLKRPTLIIRTAFKDDPASLKDTLDNYEDFQKNKHNLPPLHNDDLIDLNKSYEKGVSPNQAAVSIIKWCDTPEEAGAIVASSSGRFGISYFITMGCIIALCSLMIILYNAAKESSNIGKEVENSVFIYNKTVDFFNVKNNLDLNNEKAIDVDIFPDGMKKSADTVYNQWDGLVFIKGTSLNNFKLSYTHMPSDKVCFGFIKKQKDIGWTSVVIDNREFNNYNTMNNAQLLKACDTTNDYVDILLKKNEK